MAKSFKNLREEMTPERRKLNQLRTEFALFEMSLAEIRQHRWLADPDSAKNFTVATIANEHPSLYSARHQVESCTDLRKLNLCPCAVYNKTYSSARSLIPLPQWVEH